MGLVNNKTKFAQEIHERVVDPARRVMMFPDTGEAYQTPPGGGFSRFTTGASYSPVDTFWQGLESAVSSFASYIQSFFGRVEGFQNDDIILDVLVRTPQGNKWIYNLPMHVNNIEKNQRTDLLDYLKQGFPLSVKILYDGGKPSECAPVSYQFIQPPVQHVVAELQNTATTPQGLTGTSGGISIPGVGSLGANPQPIDGNSYAPSGMVKGAAGFSCDPPCCVYAFRTYINQAAQAFNVDSNLVAAIITQESAGNPRATSGAGARGLGQFLDPTFLGDAYPAAFAKNNNLFKDPYNAITGVWCTAAYLSILQTRYVNSPGNLKVEWIIRAYNTGAGNVNGYIAAGADPWKVNLGTENNDYLRRVYNYLVKYSNRSIELGKLKINQRREVKKNDTTNAASKSGIAVGTTD